MRSWPFALLLLVLASPHASACSIAYQPFEAPALDPMRYVDGTRLVVVHEQTELVEAEGYFLSFAPVADGVLVAGQEGLGADCSGQGWLVHLREGGEAWRRDGEARVWAHPEGPVVRTDGRYWQFADGRLVAFEADVPADVQVLGWSHGLEPVYRDDARGQLGVGPTRIPMDGAGWPVVAASSDSTGILVVERGADGTPVEAALHVVNAEGVVTTRWTGGAGYLLPSLAWGEAWWAVAGGRAYRIVDTVVDLGLAADSAGSDGTSGFFFSGDGGGRHHVVHGDRTIQSWQRVQGVWVPDSPAGSPAPVEATTSAAPGMEGPGGSEAGDAQAPGPGLPLAIAAFLLVAWRRRARGIRSTPRGP